MCDFKYKMFLDIGPYVKDRILSSAVQRIDA